MTNEEERELRAIIAECRRPDWKPGVHLIPQLEDRRNTLADIAERLLKENSELRVRDSNVTAHSLNVVAINEDLQAKLKERELAVESSAWFQHMLSEDFAQDVGDAFVTMQVNRALGRLASKESRVHQAAMLQYQKAIHTAVGKAKKRGIRFPDKELPLKERIVDAELSE